MPIGNQEISESYDYTMKQHFGSAYDPSNPTAQQAQWATGRYSGWMGPLNSVSDGMDYKLRWMNRLPGMNR